jgi:hypothetical protein
MPRHKSKSGAKRIAHMDMVMRALELRRDGKTCQQVADELGLSSAGHAHKLITTAIATAPLEAIDEVRKMEVARLENLYDRALQRGERAKADGHKLEALSLALRISERRSKLLGLDAATKWEIGGAAGLASLPIEKIVAVYVASGRPQKAWPPAVQEFAQRLGAVGEGGAEAGVGLPTGGKSDV